MRKALLCDLPCENALAKYLLVNQAQGHGSRQYPRTAGGHSWNNCTALQAELGSAAFCARLVREIIANGSAGEFGLPSATDISWQIVLAQLEVAVATEIGCG